MTVPHLRFLADESCDFTVGRALRGAGYNVLAVSEVTQRSDDSELIAQAAQEKRILLTEDKDFGWLVYVSHAESAGVILVRFPGNARSTLGQAILRLVQARAGELDGCFTVVEPGRIRISRKPTPQER
jgi:predicted nuclease of predicted toxin-antitoxin system